jgi:hypothetical protein
MIIYEFPQILDRLSLFSYTLFFSNWSSIWEENKIIPSHSWQTFSHLNKISENKKKKERKVFTAKTSETRQSDSFYRSDFGKSEGISETTLTGLGSICQSSQKDVPIYFFPFCEIVSWILCQIKNFLFTMLT